jgi:hypothetical protein
MGTRRDVLREVARVRTHDPPPLRLILPLQRLPLPLQDGRYRRRSRGIKYWYYAIIDIFLKCVAVILLKLYHNRQTLNKYRTALECLLPSVFCLSDQRRWSRTAG